MLYVYFLSDLHHILTTSKHKGNNMKVPISIINTLPVAQVMELAHLLIQHASNMQKMELEYQYSKAAMQEQFSLDKEKLHVQLQQILSMLDSRDKQFTNLHIERSMILNMIQDLQQSLPSSHQTDTVLVLIDRLRDDSHAILEREIQHSSVSLIGNI